MRVDEIAEALCQSTDVTLGQREPSQHVMTECTLSVIVAIDLVEDLRCGE